MYEEWSTLKKLIWIYIVKLKNKIEKLLVRGMSPLFLTNAAAGRIVSLIQYGKCEQNGTPTSSVPVDIYCNNGALKWDGVNQRIYADGTPEVLTVGGANLLNPQTVPSDNQFVNKNTGGLTTPSATGGVWRYGDYIPVIGGETYYFHQINATATTAGTAWYDSEQTYIGGINATALGNANNKVTMPSNAAYIRHSWRIDEGYNTDWENTVYICIDGTMTEFKPYVAPQTASVENLLSVGNIADEQDIISGTIKRRCEAIVYDGTQTVTEPYLSSTGGKDNGAIIVQPKGTEYSGSIVSLDFDPENEEFGALSVAIEPVQDLHGYDAPWPSGGGKNKLPPAAVTGSTVVNNVTFTAYADGHYHISKGAGSNGAFCTFNLVEAVDALAGMYLIPKCVSINGSVTMGLRDANNSSIKEVYCGNTNPTAIQTTATATMFYLYVAGSVENIEYDIYPMLADSVLTTWYTYSNICSIGGFSAVGIEQTKKNLFGGSYNTSYSIFIPAGTEVTVSIDTHEAPVTQFRAYRADNTMIDFWSVSDTALDGTRLKKTITFTEDVYSVKFQNASADNIQIELGSTASSYSAFIGTTHTTTFPVVSANQWDEEYQTGYYNSSGVYTFASGQLCTKNKIPVFPETQYRLVLGSLSYFRDSAVSAYDVDENFISRTILSGATFTTPADCKFINVNFGATYGGTYGNNIAVNYPASITTYNPYSRTVYGGTLEYDGDVLKFVADRVHALFTDSLSISNWYTHDATYDTWGFYSNYDDFWRAVIGVRPIGNLMSDMFPTVSSVYAYDHLACSVALNSDSQMTYMAFRIPKSMIATPTDGTNLTALIKAWLAENPIGICFRIAPIEIPLTLDTPIELFDGENNLWSDAGDMKVLVLTPTTEQATPQSLSTTHGTNIISVTAEVDDIELEAVYKGKNQ